jgi:hypothetical protein
LGVDSSSWADMIVGLISRNNISNVISPLFILYLVMGCLNSSR